MTYVPRLEDQALRVAQVLNLELQDFVGHGAFKETFQATDNTGTVVALKIIDRAKIDLARTTREINALQRCNSPNIAQIKHWESFDGPDISGVDAVVEEFLDGGTLEQKLASGNLSAPGIVILGCGLSRALVELYAQDLVHRDIKPANIMFRANSPDPVLVDFGLVRDLKKESLTQSWMPHGPCTPLYASPEQLNNEKRMIDWRSDQFSLGVVLVEALTGRHPYTRLDFDTDDTLSAVARRTTLPQELLATLKAERLEFLSRLVQPWPVQRVPLPIDLLNHFQEMLK